MNLQWQGHEEVRATKEQLWAFINDPRNVADCVPDLVAATVKDARHVDATVAVRAGFLRGKLQLRIELDPQPGSTRMNMKISGGGLGSAVDLLAGADLADNGNATTSLDWHATATMRGPIAAVGGRVVDAKAQHVISTTFANVKARCTTSNV